MANTDSNVSKAAHLGGTLGMAAVAFLVIGVSCATLELLPAFGGFLVMVLGLGMALVGIVTSIVGVVATAPGKNRDGRSSALRGLLLSLVTIGSLAVPISHGAGVPRINDITTDLNDPPVFVSALEHEANRGRDMAYPGAGFADQQVKAYPDLASLVLEDAPAAAFDRVHAALAVMPRLRITGENLAEGRIEATETSALFHFADDVVVRIRPYEDGGSRVDVRSKSRDGKGDSGVNATRIRKIFALVRGGAAEPSGRGGD